MDRKKKRKDQLKKPFKKLVIKNHPHLSLFVSQVKLWCCQPPSNEDFEESN